MSQLTVRFAVALAVATLISVRAYRRKSLDLSGAISGFAVFAAHIASGYRWGAVLLVFFITASKITKVGQDKKRAIEDDFKEGGQRNWVQVVANSIVATVLVIIISVMTGGEDMCLDSKKSRILTCLIGGVIGHYACCNGDTWSSELGVLSTEQPRLITTLKPVRKGTNGGVTLQGLLAAAAGGFVVGLTFFVVGLLTARCHHDVALRQLIAIPLAATAGLVGSIIDSLLGATIQFSGYCSVRKKVVSKRGPTVTAISGLSILDNNGVNAVSVVLTTLITSYACLVIF